MYEQKKICDFMVREKDPLCTSPLGKKRNKLKVTAHYDKLLEINGHIL